MEFKYYLRGLGLGMIVTAIIMGVTAARRQTMTNEEIIARAKELGMIENTVLTQSVDEEADPGDGTADGTSPAPEGDLSAAAGDGTDGDADKNGDTATDNGVKADTATNNGSKADAATDNGNKADAAAEGGNGTDADSRDRTNASDRSGDDETSGMAGRNDDNALETTAAAQQTDSGNDAGRTQKKDCVIVISNGDGSFSVSKKLADAGAVVSAADFDTFLCENGYDKRIRAGTYTIPADAGDEQMARIITGAE